MALAAMGYHLQVMTRKLSRFRMPELPAGANEAGLPAERA
jgi:hypothetical protein